MRLDLTGKKIGRWLVVDKSEVRAKNGDVLWNCICDCGNRKVCRGWILNKGGSLSCGCFNREMSSEYHTRHGLSRSKTYCSWQGAKERCTNKDNPAYSNYGGRGIRVCDRWLPSFDNFLEDMGEAPEGMTLDRIDVNGNYCKENCRWADASMQNFNKRKFRRNTSGRTGVNWFKPAEMWRAYITKDGKQISLGYFHNFEDAVRAREAGELLYYGFNMV